MADAPEIKHIFSAEDEDCLSLEAMRAYQAGKLAAAARHQVERHLLNCELCSMAIEGIEDQPDAVIEAGAAAISSAAWERVQEKSKRRVAYIWISAAASVMLLVAVGWALLAPPSEEKMQAVFSEMIEASKAEDSVLQQDIAQARPLEEVPANEAIASESQPVADAPQPLETKANQSLARKAAKEPVNVYSEKEMANSGPPGAYKSSESPLTGKDAMKGGNAAPAPVASPKNATAAKPKADRSYAEEDAVFYNDEQQQSLGDVDDAVVITEGARQLDKKELVVTVTPSDVMEKRRAAERQKTRAMPEKKSATALKSPASGKASTVPAVADREAEEEDAELSAAPALQTITFGAANASGVVMDSVSADFGYVKSNFDQGMDAYLRKDFATAATQLRAAAALTPSNLQAHLYAATSFLNIGQPEAALFHLDRILAQAPNAYTEDAEWYKALAYLKMNDAATAKKQLNKVKNANGKHSAKAKVSLEKL